MRTRLTLTKRIGDGLYVSQSAYPKFPRQSLGSALAAFLVGALLFVIFGLVVISVCGG